MIWRCFECNEACESPSLPAYCPDCGEVFVPIFRTADEPTDDELTRPTQYIPDTRDEHDWTL